MYNCYHYLWLCTWVLKATFRLEAHSLCYSRFWSWYTNLVYHSRKQKSYTIIVLRFVCTTLFGWPGATYSTFGIGIIQYPEKGMWHNTRGRTPLPFQGFPKWNARRVFLMCARGFSNLVVFFSKKNSTILKKNTTTYLILDIKNTTKSRRFEKNTTKFHFWITFVQKKHNKAIFWYG